MRKIFTNKILLGILCIAVGMAPLLTLINTIGSGKALFTRYFNRNDNKLISIKLSGAQVTYGDFKKLSQEMPEIKAMIPVAKAIAPISSYKSNSIVEARAVGSDYWKVSALDITKGKFISKGHIENNQNVIVVDDLTADTLFGTTDILGRSVKVNFNGVEIESTVIGICKRIDAFAENLDEKNGLAYIPISVLDYNSDRYNIDEALLLVNLHVEEAKARVSHYLESIGVGEGQFEISYVNQMNLIKSFLDANFNAFLVAAAIWFLAAMVALINFMLVEIEQGKRYYGLLKFYGNTAAQIRRIVFGNALALGLGASVFSTALGLISSFVICAILNIPLHVSIHTLTLGALVPCIVSLIAAIYPAIRATKVDKKEAIL